MLVFTVDGAPLASAPVAGEAHMPPGYRVKAVDGHGYRITPPTGSDWVAHSDTPAGDLIAALVAAPKASEAVRLDAPAQVGGVRFGKGIHWSTVISAAQRHHAFMNTPEKEAERIARAKEFVESIQADKDGECKPCNGMGRR
ncbi:hypothetical protein G6F65_021753 [Rhizopus arrhizus]|nr:hypothetical protein G6F65_021753 [Rhizopus arrhizus]